jgi:DNA-binding transcriptional regulator YhcF (GntR family)
VRKEEKASVEESSINSVYNFLKSTKADPEIVYAFQKTGILVTEKNMNLLSEEKIKEWNDAIAEFINPQ